MLAEQAADTQVVRCAGAGDSSGSLDCSVRGRHGGGGCNHIHCRARAGEALLRVSGYMCHREDTLLRRTPDFLSQAAVFQLAELTPQTAALIASLGGPFLSIAELAFILRCACSSAGEPDRTPTSERD